jgi:hypothetical protein
VTNGTRFKRRCSATFNGLGRVRHWANRHGASFPDRVTSSFRDQVVVFDHQYAHAFEEIDLFHAQKYHSSQLRDD